MWLLPALLLATWLGARGLNADLLFVDEYWSIRNAGGAYFGPRAPLDIWRGVAEVDPGGVGILYYHLLAAWGALTGWTAYAARAFSLLAGLLAAAMTYRLGRALFGARVGLYAAVALALSAFYIDYLHEMRAYTLYALLTVVMLWAYWRLIREAQPARWLYVVLGMSFVGLAYTHYVALAAAGALGVYHLLLVRKDRRWWVILGVMALSAACYLPWLGVTLDVISRGAEQTTRQETSMNSGQTLETLLHAFSNGNSALLALLAGYALLERRRAALFVGFIALLTLLAALLVNSLILFMVHIRYLMALWPLLALIVGLGIARMERARPDQRPRLSGAFILLVWAGAGIWQSLNPAFINQLFGQIYRAPAAGVHAALDTLRTYAHPDDAVLFHIAQPGYEPFNYFVIPYYMHDVPGQYDQIERVNNSFAKDDNGYLLDVLTFLNDKSAVWTLVVPEIPTTQRAAVVDYVLRTQFAHCERVIERADMRMDYYARVPALSTPARYAFTVEGGGQVALSPYEIARYGDDLRALLGWAGDAAVPAGVYSVALHLENAAGQLVAQDDYALPNPPFGCGAGHLALDGLPPGEYTLLAAVYAWQTGARQPGTDHESGQQADRLVIARIRVG